MVCQIKISSSHIIRKLMIKIDDKMYALKIFSEDLRSSAQKSVATAKKAEEESIDALMFR